MKKDWINDMRNRELGWNRAIPGGEIAVGTGSGPLVAYNQTSALAQTSSPIARVHSPGGQFHWAL